MPRGRKPTARAASGGQSRLSFNNRVTKTSAQTQRDEQTASAKKLSQIEETLPQEQPEPEPAEVKITTEREPTQPKTEDDEEETEQIIQEEPEPSKSGTRRKVKAVKGKDERELAAEKVTDAQLKKYWQKEEDARLAPRGTDRASPSLILHPYHLSYSRLTISVQCIKKPSPSTKKSSATSI